MTKFNVWALWLAISILVGTGIGFALAKIKRQDDGDRYCYPFQLFGFGQDSKPVCASYLPREDYDD